MYVVGTMRSGDELPSKPRRRSQPAPQTRPEPSPPDCPQKQTRTDDRPERSEPAERHASSGNATPAAASCGDRPARRVWLSACRVQTRCRYHWAKARPGEQWDWTIGYRYGTEVLS
ncbi:hypothetical protein BDY21DRAFT_214745 [Lineolata rhizophorae]|uniref:Uncharacterized protein n=1 Tax=Lineolata rhizophorae TaxID=578093 RepID=A0A6A6P309_9PEZI|nr:hypothetical protein BDY21DRAFT_214745 [Lineolata rhizophorae]